jgi:hypothetical protein
MSETRPPVVSDARAALWESTAVEAIANAEVLDGAAPTLAHAVLALVKDRREWQRYAQRLTSGPQS